MAELEQYLEEMRDMRRRSFERQGTGRPPGWNYDGLEDYVLDRGKRFESAPLTSYELGVVKDAVGRIYSTGSTLEVKQCFENAQRLVLASSGALQYQEGFAVGHLFPIHHAWVTICGKVVDLTWSRLSYKERDYEDPMADRILGEFPEDWVYLGVSFPIWTIRHVWHEHEMATTLLLNALDNFPVFRERRIHSD